MAQPKLPLGTYSISWVPAFCHYCYLKNLLFQKQIINTLFSLQILCTLALSIWSRVT